MGIEEYIIQSEDDIPDHLQVEEAGRNLLEHSGYCFAWDTDAHEPAMVKYEGESLSHGRDGKVVQ